MTTIYHCSNVRITRFNFEEGCHFGGKFSALEAGLRKVVNEDDVLYLHKLKLLPCSLCEGDDVGSKQCWDEVLLEIDGEWDGVVYRNKYEPDTSSSYFLIEDVVECTSVEVITARQAEQLLCTMYTLI